MKRTAELFGCPHAEPYGPWSTACARVRGDARYKLLRRLPYVLTTLAEPEHIEASAVFHTSRDPVEWQERVR